MPCPIDLMTVSYTVCFSLLTKRSSLAIAFLRFSSEYA